MGGSALPTVTSAAAGNARYLEKALQSPNALP